MENNTTSETIVLMNATLVPFIYNSTPIHLFLDLTHIILSFTEVISQCYIASGSMVWLGLKVFILATALPSNVALMWLLLKNGSSMTPSQVLALNISIMDILYCFALPFDIYVTLHEMSSLFHDLCAALSVLNIFSCPLLLTLMCLERYIATTFPLMYLRLGKWEYRIILCVLAWILTLVGGLLLYIFQTFTAVLALVVTITVLFLIMLLCLIGIVWVLCESRPGDRANGTDSIKKRALSNILMVMVPSVVAYSPLVAVVPYLAVIISKDTQQYSREQCTVIQTLLIFPNLGLYIGPMFYLSKLRQKTCCRKETENTNTGRNLTSRFTGV